MTASPASAPAPVARLGLVGVTSAPVDLTPVYLTAAGVAELLQLSPKTIYRLAAEDATFPVLRIGGTVRFPRERLLRWLRDREQGRPQAMRRQVLSSPKSASRQEALGA